MKRIALPLVLATMLSSMNSDTRGTTAPRIFNPLESHFRSIRGEVVDYSPALTVGVTQRWKIRLETRAGESVSNARVAVVVYMPESGERSLPSPVARYLGAGQYEIEGLRFSKPGWWNVGLAVQYSGGTDSLAFNLIIPK